MDIPELAFEVSLYTNFSLKTLPMFLNSQQAYTIIKECFTASTFLWKEEFLVLCMNNNRQIIGYHKLSLGGMTATIVDVRAVFTVALKSLAAGIIIAHNHPSGKLKPSKEDILLTKKIKQAGEILDIPLLDHFIVTHEEYLSFKEVGLL